MHMNTHATDSLARTVLGSIGAAGALAMTVGTSRGASAFPPLGRLSDWPVWVVDQGPASALVALVRAGVALAALYVLVVGLLTLTARLFGSVRLATAVDRVTVGSLRSMLVGTTVLALLGSGPAASAATSSASTHSTTAMATVVPSTPTSPSAPPVAHLVVEPTAPVTSERQRVLSAGDHLWSVAADEMTMALGRSPNESEVVRYWSTLVEANRERLADPANPDLVFAGQVIVVPPVTS